MHVLHKWSRWEFVAMRYTDRRSGTRAYGEEQERRCEKCGLTEQRPI